MGRNSIHWLCGLALLLATGVNAHANGAGDCPGRPDALGTSRTIVVDPREHARIGTMSYAETLPLVDKEVVLTFDDGPLPAYSNKILDMLAAECVRATYFVVGTMAKAYPDVVRRIHAEGHTIGTHSMSHPIKFRRQSFEGARRQVEDGIAATAEALGDPRQVAPFFRFPGFGNSDDVEDYLAERGLQAWGADIPADDWHRISGREVANRALRRLDARGKGILLLHDIHQRTVDALPTILTELKARGYRIVHVMPATAERPKTITTAAEWRTNAPRGPRLPDITLADVRDPDGERLALASADELCMLYPPRLPWPRPAPAQLVALRAQAEHGRSQAQPSPSQAQHKPAKMARGKSRKATQVAAHGYAMPDVHAIR